MKRGSIKIRITAWYTFFIVCLTIIFIASVLFVSRQKDDEDLKDNLKMLVKTIEDEVDEANSTDTIKEDLNRKIVNNYIAIYNKDGVLIKGTEPRNYTGGIEFDNKEFSAVIIDNNMYYIYDRKENTKDSTVWIRGFTHALSVTDIVNNIIRIVCIGFPILMILIIAGGYLISVKALKPLEDMNRAADEINGGSDLSKRIPVGKRSDEISRLSITLNSMWARLEQSFHSEKRFISDASHELRTPTSVILAQCELCLENEQDNQTYHEALELIQRQGGKLKKLISELLEITRLDNMEIKKVLEKTNVSELVEIVCEEQKLAHSGCEITLEAEIEQDLVTIINPTLFMRACNNLINNAYQYSKPKGKIKVILGKSGDNGASSIVLKVIDDGIGISTTDQEKIWGRFYQVDEARSNNGSMGLGLSMVERIAKYHDGKAEVVSMLGEGSTFVLTLPMK